MVERGESRWEMEIEENRGEAHRAAGGRKGMRKVERGNHSEQKQSPRTNGGSERDDGSGT